MGSPTTRFPMGRPSNLEVTFDRAAQVVEGAVLDLLSGGWEEELRKLTCLMAASLRQVSKDAGWWDHETAFRALESILALSAAELLPIRQPMGLKLLDLLILIKKPPVARTA